MITFNGIDYFSSGPCNIELGPLDSRDTIADAPGSVGSTVITQGVAPRILTQRGTLVADSAEALQALIKAIEANVGGTAGVLVDRYAGDCSDCLMRRVEAGSFRRLGPRFSVDYEITYLQARS